MTMAVCGYVSTGDNTADIVTESNTFNSFFGTLMTIARIGVFIKLSVSIPCHFYPLKVSVFQIFFNEKDGLVEPAYI
jgi:hypothetical protein